MIRTWLVMREKRVSSRWNNTFKGFELESSMLEKIKEGRVTRKECDMGLKRSAGVGLSGLCVKGIEKPFTDF